MADPSIQSACATNYSNLENSAMDASGLITNDFITPFTNSMSGLDQLTNSLYTANNNWYSLTSLKNVSVGINSSLIAFQQDICSNQFESDLTGLNNSIQQYDSSIAVSRKKSITLMILAIFVVGGFVVAAFLRAFGFTKTGALFAGLVMLFIGGFAAVMYQSFS